MTSEQYKQAANYWKIKDQESVKMDRTTLFTLVKEYINANNVCALATGAGDFVRCTPIEYSYHDDAFWMFSEGGEKFIALEENKKVCLAIFHKYEGFSNVKGMQIMGTATLIDYFSKEYIKAAEYKKIPLETLKKFPEPLNLIKVLPIKVDFLNSEFKKYNVSSRQSLEF